MIEIFGGNIMILSCNNIKKSYGANLILNNINFQINKGDRVALVGRNGSGKSTLFKIIVGELSCDEGSCNRPKNTTIGYLSQQLALKEEHSLWEELLEIYSPLIQMETTLRNLEKEISHQSNTHHSQKLNSLMEQYGHLQEEFEKQNGYGYPSQIRRVLNGLGFKEEDYQKQIHKFSGGQKTRIALAKLLLKQPDILLLDEPTNYLDLETTEWLESFLLNYPHTLFIISHDRYFLDKLVTQVFELENKKLTVYQGNYSDYVRRKKENLEITQRHYQQQQKEIQRQEQIIAKYRSFNREKSIQKAESRQKMLDKMEKIEPPTSEVPTLRFKIQSQIKSGRNVLKVENLSKSFGEKKLFSNINFQVYRQDHIGIIGPNGIGKSTLFKMILGQIPFDEGKIIWGHNVYSAYYDQLQNSFKKENTILEEVWSAKPSATQTEIRNLLGSFLFSEEDVFKTISSLSGGEKSRVSLAKLLLSEANLLFMDEPTNHLDIPTKEALENALCQYEGTLMVISHDRYFLNKVVNKIYKIEQGTLKEYLGNYEYYLEKIHQKQLLEKSQKIQPTINKTQLKQERKKIRENRQRIKKQQQRVQNLENKVSKLEEKISETEKIMCQPDFYNDNEKAVKITKEYEIMKEQVKIIINQWEEEIIRLEEIKEEGSF